MSIGLIILAAGGSTRLGRPKQLLQLNGQTLIRRAATAAVESRCDRVVVVVGSSGEDVKRELDGLAVSIIENPAWQSGMSSSIRAGLSQILNHDAVLIMLCDQPFVPADVVDNLIDTYHKTGMPIVASDYGVTRGVPALFSRELFSELVSLTGDEGARRIIVMHPGMVETIAFADGAIDVDTREQLDRIFQDLQNESCKSCSIL